MINENTVFTTGPVDNDMAKAAAALLEKELLEIMNHKRKPGNLDLKALMQLITYARQGCSDYD